MNSSQCQCGNPQACTCFSQTPRRNNYYDAYQSPGPQGHWPSPNPYYGPIPPQAFVSMSSAALNSVPLVAHENFAFQNTFPASFDYAAPTSRTPFVDTTNTTNTAAAPTRGKRKRRGGAQSAPARSRRRVDADSVDPLGPSHVHGAGPSTSSSAAAAAASESVSHPSIPATNRGSLLDKPTATSGFLFAVFPLALHHRRCRNVRKCLRNGRTSRSSRIYHAVSASDAS
ncbi:hypothetical protein GGX14DRAFT_579832 [Mycena pura]|uniref:Uncharacterized protein n=1 Tax=Mycena pura TaxID=153505 RepID=A0AAD6UMG9_9AGAR|nr:hypothetical protein GGX14DRAFT_579832 [Mycena pura]